MPVLGRVRGRTAGLVPHLARRARKARRALLEKWRIRQRWRRRRPVKGVTSRPSDDGHLGLARCDVVYINLDIRTDRREQIERELGSIGIERFERFPAIPDRRGSIGCARSHEAALERWDPLPGRLLLVLEDDCAFLADRAALDRVIEEFAGNGSLAVLCLANETKWSIPVSRELAVSANIQTTAAYVVKPWVVGELIETFDESACRLAAGEPDSAAACDVVWKRVQATRFFAVPRKELVTQRPGFSDIGGRWISHSD